MRAHTAVVENENREPSAAAFRYVGYSLLALAVCCLVTTERSGLLIALLLAWCVCWPFVARYLEQRPEANCRMCNAFECFVGGALAGLVVLPLVPLTALSTALLAGNAAQGGLASLGRGLAALLTGTAVGFVTVPLSSGQWFARLGASTLPADLVSLLFILVYSVLLSERCYRQAIRLHSAKSRHARRFDHAARLSARLARYVPEDLHRRLRLAPEARCPLERHWVTIAFIDVVGFTELAGRLAPEALSAVLNDYLAMLEAEIALHDGTLGKLLGDGVLVFFAANTAAERRKAGISSVKLSLKVQRELAALAGQWRQQGYLVELSTRTGIASGFCTLGDWGGDGRLDYTVIGSAVNLASRLQVAAAIGGILVCAATAAILSPGLPQPVVLETPVKQKLKGFGELLVFPVVSKERQLS